ncbi:hypothetical protein BDR03DRAFT_878696, partial [Suillus americanus]
VHWLRAKALRDRWKEEILLVQLEMDWTCNYFLWKASQWGDRMCCRDWYFSGLRLILFTWLYLPLTFPCLCSHIYCLHNHQIFALHFHPLARLSIIFLVALLLGFSSFPRLAAY